MSDDRPALFQVFNEIGIIGQLSSTLFEAQLPDGILVSHFSVINHLVRLGDGKTPLALARAFQVPKTTMTHTLRGLVKRGWIEMAPNPEDARSKLVLLTDPGRQFCSDAIAALGPDMSRLNARIDLDVAGVLRDLRQLREVLDIMRDEHT